MSKILLSFLLFSFSSYCLHKNETKALELKHLCGICKKDGAYFFWPHPQGDTAHHECYDLVKEAEEEVMQDVRHTYVNPHFNTKYFFELVNICNQAHSAMIHAIEKEIKEKNHPTLKDYLEKHSKKDQKHLFNKTGLTEFGKFFMLSCKTIADAKSKL